MHLLGARARQCNLQSGATRGLKFFAVVPIEEFARKLFQRPIVKISPSATPPASTAGSYAAGDARVRQQTRTEEAPSGDDVRVSLSRSEETASSDGPFDAGRVAAIRQAISEGRFSINSGAIADRLLATARELVQGSPERAGRQA